jgi:N-acetylneuraminic acid mutarotase
MSRGRSFHTITVLSDGKLLVTGGFNYAHHYWADCEVYDPKSDKWTPIASMTTARAAHTATLLPSGKILVTGGASGDSMFEALASCEVYDPVSNTWVSVADMSTLRLQHVATLLPSHKILVTGGIDLPLF